MLSLSLSLSLSQKDILAPPPPPTPLSLQLLKFKITQLDCLQPHLSYQIPSTIKVPYTTTYS